MTKNTKSSCYCNKAIILNLTKSLFIILLSKTFGVF